MQCFSFYDFLPSFLRTPPRFASVSYTHLLDGVPYIGPYSSSAPFLHVATGFGKWGMTGSMVAATLLTARLTGEDYPYADIFSPQRFFPSASISAFWEGAGYAVRGIGRRLFVPAQTAAADIARGHGASPSLSEMELTTDLPCVTSSPA